jgi:hypothetical protein
MRWVFVNGNCSCIRELSLGRTPTENADERNSGLAGSLSVEVRVADHHTLVRSDRCHPFNGFEENVWSRFGGLAVRFC